MPPRGERPSPEACTGREALCEVIGRIANEHRAVMVTVANSAVTEQVRFLFQSLVLCGVKNFLVIALDDGMVKFCKNNHSIILQTMRKGTMESVQ